jgi:hypothetical protein
MPMLCSGLKEAWRRLMEMMLGGGMSCSKSASFM